MTEHFKGFIDLTANDQETIERLYEFKEVPLPDPELAKIQNLYVELHSPILKKSTALCRVSGDKLILIDGKATICGMKPRNREQAFAINALLDPTIQLVVIPGRIGSGKTILSIAGGLHFVEKHKNGRLILTKPMTQIGKHELGILPGELESKLNPYLRNYESNFKQVLGKDTELVDVVSQYKAEFIPIQLFLGASFVNTCLIIDEVQGLSGLELGALLTRTGDKSKIVVMGDYKQTHDRVYESEQGLVKLVNSPAVQASPLVAVVELIKTERSPLAALMASVFEE